MVEKRVRIIRLQDASPTFRTPPNRHLLPWRPVRTPPSQVLTQGDPNLALLDGGVGREQRGRNLRPLPRPMDGSNSAIERYLSQALVLSASSSKVCSQKNPWRVRLRQGHASRRSSRLTNAIRHLHSRHGVIAAGVQADILKTPHPPSEHHPTATSCRATH